jgi:hypothetical protein
MADESVASIIPWHQRQATKSPEKRSRVAKPRKPSKPKSEVKTKAAASDDELHASKSLIAPDFMEFVKAQAKSPPALTGVWLDEATSKQTTAAPLAAPATPEAVAPDDDAARPNMTSILLRAAALALAGVGMAMNGWFAQSLGSSHVAGWMFLAIGVAADLVALVMPTCAARLWHARHCATALAGWAVWTMTFVFAVTAGIGFASTNISEVAFARASRVTLAIEAAHASLTDAMSARDRECKGGVGKFCREREAAVAERRRAFDIATQSVAQTADPQTEAAIKLVAWLSHGLLKPEADDFAMLRLVLLALLPQLAGVLLMVGRRA